MLGGLGSPIALESARSLLVGPENSFSMPDSWVFLLLLPTGSKNKFSTSEENSPEENERADYGDATELVKLYHPQATLLPTVSDEVR